MTSDKKELAVAALRAGTVIDHIPAPALFAAVRILGIESMDKSVTIGNNLASGRLGSKGIIKVADTEFPQDVLDRIAIIAPTAVVNIIRDYEVVEKRPVNLPDVDNGNSPLPQSQVHYQPRAYAHTVRRHKQVGRGTSLLLLRP